MHSITSVMGISARRRTAILASTVFIGLIGSINNQLVSLLVPALHLHYGLRLSTAGIIIMVATFGGLVSAYPWGMLIDRIGERKSLAISSGSNIIGNGIIFFLLHYHCQWTFLSLGFFLTAMTTYGSINSGGRLIAGWYKVHERGRALAIRQTAPPVAVGLSALTIPYLSLHYSPETALIVPFGISLIGFLLNYFFIIDPPVDQGKNGTEATQVKNPYKGDSFLPRLHIVSAVLSVPQSLLWQWIPIWLSLHYHLAPFLLGCIICFTQAFGAMSRILAGSWSDRIHNRLKPVRIIAIATIIALLTLVLLDLQHSLFAIVAACIASIFSVADNALEFTAVAEFAGKAWGGRSLSIHNASQLGAVALVSGQFGRIVEASSYTMGFATLIIFPIISLLALPADRTHQVQD